jgi:hypothetical protein
VGAIREVSEFERKKICNFGAANAKGSSARVLVVQDRQQPAFTKDFLCLFETRSDNTGTASRIWVSPTCP